MVFRRSFFGKRSTEESFLWLFVGVYSGCLPPKDSFEDFSSEPTLNFFPPKVLILSFLVEKSLLSLRRNAVIHELQWHATEIAVKRIFVGALSDSDETPIFMSFSGTPPKSPPKSPPRPPPKSPPRLPPNKIFAGTGITSPVPTKPGNQKFSIEHAARDKGTQSSSPNNAIIYISPTTQQKGADMNQNTQLLNGRYRLRTVLGTGGFSTIYLAVDETTGREVSIKEFTAEHMDGLATADRGR